MIDRRPWLQIIFSLAIALVLQLFELPYPLAVLRPLWVPMILVYWATVIPEPTGLLTAFITGLLLDVLLGNVLGQHALGLTLIVFITLMLRGWVMLFPVWQEALIMGGIWALYSFLMFWVDGATGRHSDPWLRWLPVATTTVAWPIVLMVINELRHRSQRDPLGL